MKPKAQGKTGRPDSSPKRQPRRNVLLGGAIVAIALAVYAPAIRGGFVWDDVNYIARHPYMPTAKVIQADDGLRRIWLTAETADYWPLTHTMFFLEWRLWGESPAGYHAVNILLHALAAVLVWRVLQQLNVPGAWLAGLIFAVHPVCAASVAWISERKNTLSMVLYLLAILAYLKHLRSASWWWYVAAVATFALGLLSKSSIVMLPVVLLGCAWWLRGRNSAKDLLRGVPFFVLAGVMALVTIYFHQQHAIGDWAVSAHRGFFSRLAAAGWIVWFYLYKALLPVNLSVIYPKWSVEAGRGLSWLPLGALLACLAVLWRYRRTRARPVLFALGYLAVTLFPVMGFFEMSFMRYSLVADHLQYVSILGVIALVAGLLGRLCKAKKAAPRKIGWMVATVWVAALSILTWRQAGIYESTETLWGHTIAKNPNAWSAHYNLGVFYFKTGRLEEAGQKYRKSIELKPGHAETHNNLGAVYYETAQLDRAAEHYRRAIQLAPKYPNPYLNLGNVYANLGKLNEAMEHYHTAIEKNPDYAQAHYNLAVVLAKTGQLDEAMEHYRTAVRIRPNNAAAHYNLALALAERGKLGEAAEHYRTAIRIKPDYAKAHNNLGLVLARMGKLDEAIEHYRRAIRIRPSHAGAHRNLAVALERQGKIGQAIAYYRRTLQIKPRDLKALRNLAWLLATAPQEKLRDGPKALELAGKAVQLAGDEPSAALLDTLAAAQAEAGRFPEAVTTAQNALQLAAGKQPRLAEEISARLALYKARKPYHQPQ